MNSTRLKERRQIMLICRFHRRQHKAAKEEQNALLKQFCGQVSVQVVPKNEYKWGNFKVQAV
jgi:hypothetical protein